VYQRARRALRPLVKPGAPLPFSSPYPGHYAVTRSVVEGLRAIGADFNFNPRSFKALSRVVYAPANEALRQAIRLKRDGAIDFLVAGPGNALFLDEHDGILTRPEIDLVIVACEWQRAFYAGAPDVVSKSRVCPCGVDVDIWKPIANAPKTTALVYWKSGPLAFCEGAEAIARAHGLEPFRVATTHGDHARFTAAEYRRPPGASGERNLSRSVQTQGHALHA